MTRFDATTDAINGTVTLITGLLVALIPLFVVVAVFSAIIGMLVGRSGLFRHLGRD